MFSLIITIISIALVAALALATIYYGGDAFENGGASAQASRVLNQGQQVMAAAEMFRVQNGVWPNTVEQLVADDFLKSVPDTTAQHSMVGEAFAQAVPTTAWSIPVPGVPVFVVTMDSTPVCGEVNDKAYGLKGVLPELRLGYVSQCYGADTDSLRVVFAKDSDALTAAFPDDVSSAAIPAAADIPSWTSAPDAVVAGDPVVTPPAPAGDVIAPGACSPLRFDTSAGVVKLWNETGGPLTVTAWTGYHRSGPIPAIAVDGSFGPNQVIRLDQSYSGGAFITGFVDGSTTLPYETIWQTQTAAVNVTFPNNTYFFPTGYNGNSDMATVKGAIYVQEFGAWCAVGAHNPDDFSDVSGATKYFIGQSGTTFNPPAAMDGAWDYN